MKKIIGFVFCVLFSVGVEAAPTTQPVLSSQPKTPQTGQHMPRTNPIALSHPVSTKQASYPVTTVSGSQPQTPRLTPVDSSSDGGGNKIGSGGNYASYKNAKTLAPVETPKAAKLGKGESGLGKDQKAAQKASEAAASSAPKADSAQPSLQDVLKKTNMPDNVMGLLKQRDFEAAGTAKHGK